jgi:hypothetical protein
LEMSSVIFIAHPPDAGSPMARRYHELKRHVRFWHFSDIPTAPTNVRYRG